MSRRRYVAAMTVVTLAVATASATGAAAKAKPKPKPLKTMKGSYSVTLVPDPSIESPTIGDCEVIDPKAADIHPLTLPGTGTLHVVLDSPDPTGKGVTDWDLVILDAQGQVYDSSTGGTSHEETVDPNMKKGKISIKVCNIAGEPTGNVSYTYTYR
ncbi:MAG: hypothetical protein JO079_11260 [Frankiaceae bacterium]|nr:hypothetical protein [Frankiaceae bacterium]